MKILTRQTVSTCVVERNRYLTIEHDVRIEIDGGSMEGAATEDAGSAFLAMPGESCLGLRVGKDRLLEKHGSPFLRLGEHLTPLHGRALGTHAAQWGSASTRQEATLLTFE